MHTCAFKSTQGLWHDTTVERNVDCEPKGRFLDIGFLKETSTTTHDRVFPWDVGGNGMCDRVQVRACAPLVSCTSRCPEPPVRLILRKGTSRIPLACSTVLNILVLDGKQLSIVGDCSNETSSICIRITDTNSQEVHHAECVITTKWSNHEPNSRSSLAVLTGWHP